MKHAWLFSMAVWAVGAQDCGSVTCSAGQEKKMNPSCMVMCSVVDCCVGQCSGKCSQGYYESANTCSGVTCAQDDPECCTGNTCSNPSMSFPNSDFTDCNAKRTGDSCSPCTAGHKASSSLLLDCSATGSYTVPTTTCTPNACTTPLQTTPDTSDTDCVNAKQTGDTCDPCATGYTRSALLLLVCSDTGVYGLGSVTCNPNTCAAPTSVITNSDYAQCNTRLSGQLCDPCQKGFSPSSPFYPICSATGAYDVAVSCDNNTCNMPKMGVVAYDSCNGQQTGGSCIVDCDEGYTSTGNIDLVCEQNGSFDATGSTCVPNACNATLQNRIDRNIVSPDVCVGKSSGEKCQLECSKGYSSVPFDIVCLATGEYDVSHVVCTAFTCLTPDPSLPYTDYTPCSGSLTSTSCKPVCDTGYYLSGVIPLVCDDMGVYSTVGAVCLPNTCADPSAGTTDPEVATYDVCKGYNTAQQCPVECNAGYEGVGSLTLLCDASGSYTAGSFTCVALLCDGGANNMGSDPHASYDSCATKATGSACKPDCEFGWEASGSITLLCSKGVSGNTFDASSVSCLPNTCTVPISPTVDVDFMPCVNKQSGDICDPLCSAGYEVSSALTLACDTAGSYDVMNVSCDPKICALGPDPSTVSSLASYDLCSTLRTGDYCAPECNLGFSLQPVTGFKLMCSDTEQFNASAAKCVPNNCQLGPIQRDTHADYTPCMTLATGEICIPVCDSGYLLKGNISMQCDNGWFDASTAECVANECAGGSAGTHANMQHEHCNHLHTGQVCVPYCEKGYTLTGGTEMVMLCSTASDYNISLECLPNLCDAGPYWKEGNPGPFVPQHLPGAGQGVVNYMSCTKGKTSDMCTPTCRDGYTLSRSFILTCGANRSYEVPHDLTCKANECKNGPKNGTHSNFASYEPCDHLHTDQHCYPSCPRYYALNDSKGFNLVCGEGDTYPANEVSCLPNTCKEPVEGTTHPHTLFDNCDKNVSDETCPILCQKGYIIDKGLLMQCENNGSYEAWDVECVEKICDVGMKVSGHECIPCPYGMTTETSHSAADGNVGCIEIKKLEAKNFQMGRLAVLARVGCDSDAREAEDVPWQLHPLQIDIGSGYYKSYVGSIVCNIALLISFHCVMCGIGVFLTRSHEATYSASLGILRIPGLNTQTYAFLLPGLSLACGRIIFDPSRCAAWEVVIASIGLLFVICIQVWCWYWLRCVSTEAVLEPLEGSLPMRNFILGQASWRDSEFDSNFVGKYGVLFDAYKEKYYRFILVEQGMTLVVSLLASPESSNFKFCSARNWLMVVTMLAFLVVISVSKPFLSPLCNVLMVVSSVLQLTGLLAMSIGFENGVSNSLWMYDLADLTLSISAFSGLIKTAYDCIGLFYNVCVGDMATQLKEEAETLKEEKMKLESLKEQLREEAEKYRLNNDDEGDNITEPPEELAHPLLFMKKGKKGAVNMKQFVASEEEDIAQLREEIERLKTGLASRKKRFNEHKESRDLQSHPWTMWDDGRELFKSTTKNFLLPPSSPLQPVVHTRMPSQIFLPETAAKYTPLSHPSSPLISLNPRQTPLLSATLHNQSDHGRAEEL